MEIIFWILFIFITLSYAFRLFLRYGLPWLLKRFVQNQQKKYSDNFASNQKPSGETEIKTKPKKKKKPESNKEDFGEYVDYEDVK